jgi:hypothetical protein
MHRLSRVYSHIITPATVSSKDDQTNSRRDSAAEKLKGTPGDARSEYVPMQRGTGVAVISGVGPGTGVAIVRRFAAEGFKVAMLARSADRLASIEAELASQGLVAKGYACDVKNKEELEHTVEAIRHDFGKPSIYVHNAVQAAGEYVSEDITRNLT